MLINKYINNLIDGETLALDDRMLDKLFPVIKHFVVFKALLTNLKSGIDSNRC